MKVTKVEMDAIEAKRFSKVGERVQNVRVDQNSTITQVVGEDDEMVASFRLTINYQGLGYLKMEGDVHISGDVNPAMAEWSTKGNLPTDAANVVHNAIVSAAMPTALLVSRDIRMPPPFPLPRIQVQKKKASKPHDGVEVA